jgi:hypothetical protein
MEELGYPKLTSNTRAKPCVLVADPQNRFYLLTPTWLCREMNGKELSNRLCEIRPGLKTLFLEISILKPIF